MECVSWIHKPRRFSCTPYNPLGDTELRAFMLCETGPSGKSPSLCCYYGSTLTLALDALFWDTIYSMDIASAEGLSNITTLLHSPQKILDARNLRGDQAQRFIDLIDRVSDLDERPPVPRVLTASRSFSHYHTSMRGCPGGPRDCSTRFAEPVGCCLPRMSFVQSSSMLESSSGQAASRM